MRTIVEQMMMENTYDILYFYSHQKFYQYITLPEINVLVRFIIESQGVSEFASKLSPEHCDKYEEHLKELLVMLQNHIKKPKL